MRDAARFVAVVVLVSCFWVSAVAAPVQWTSANGGNDHWYEAIHVPDPGISWSEANVAAQSIGAGWYLGTITSQEENDFVYALTSDRPELWRTVGGMGGGPWLGGYFVGPDVDHYAWVTGEPFDYTNWAPLEPYGNGDRIHLCGYGTPMGPEWNDAPDGTVIYGYIAEGDEGTSPVEAATWSRVKGLFR